MHSYHEKGKPISNSFVIDTLVWCISCSLAKNKVHQCLYTMNLQYIKHFHRDVIHIWSSANKIQPQKSSVLKRISYSDVPARKGHHQGKIVHFASFFARLSRVGDMYSRALRYLGYLHLFIYINQIYTYILLYASPKFLQIGLCKWIGNISICIMCYGNN